MAKSILMGTLLIAALTCNSALADPFCQLHDLVPADAAPGDHFGDAIAVDGNTLVVGADEKWGTQPNAGAAYVYRFDGSAWVEVQKLEAPDAENSDRFGWSVAISNDVIVVGAAWSGPGFADVGAAYVFRYDGSTWVFEQKLIASNGISGDWFGLSVAAHENIVAVGSIHNSGAGLNSGTVYVFRHDGTSWNEEQSISASASSIFHFGNAIALGPELLVIGADYTLSLAMQHLGAVFAYRYNGSVWALEVMLTLNAPEAASNKSFGYSVATDGDTLLIGAIGDKSAGTLTGAAYVYQYNGSNWTFAQKILASDATSQARFGTSVAIRNDEALIGAYANSAAGLQSGAAYLFKYVGGSWIQEQRLLGFGANPLDGFGSSVALGVGFAVLGAPRRDIGGLDSGGGAIYLTGQTDCNVNSLCDSSVLETDCDGSGTPDDCEDDCNENGLEDSCDIAAGDADVNLNGVPDQCEVPRNRYLSVITTQPSLPSAHRVRLLPVPFIPGQEIMLGWIGTPDRDGIASISPIPSYSDQWPRLVYLRGCPIMPARTYEIAATPDGTLFDPPFTSSTVARPTPKFWGDTVGTLVGGLWSDPNGLANINDVIAALQRIQGNAPQLHFTRLDVLAVSSTDPCVNGIVNAADVFMLVKAIQGDIYPFTTDPALCPLCP